MDAFALYAALFLENGVKKGFLRTDLDVVRTSQGLIALMFEGARRALGEPDPDVRRLWVDAGMRLMFDGIALP
jgi:hypothetical protein